MRYYLILSIFSFSFFKWRKWASIHVACSEFLLPWSPFEKQTNSEVLALNQKDHSPLRISCITAVCHWTQDLHIQIPTLDLENQPFEGCQHHKYTPRVLSYQPLSIYSNVLILIVSKSATDHSTGKEKKNLQDALWDFITLVFLPYGDLL